MSSNFARVADFHTKFGYGVNCSDEELKLTLPVRSRILDEEIREIAEAVQEVVNAQTVQDVKQAKAHLAKEYIDAIYVMYGSLLAMGVDANAAFAEVHRENMSKTPSGEKYGKPIKGADYKPAEMEQFIDATFQSELPNVRVGVAAHVCRNGKVLAFQRIGNLGKNTWTVLGGHLEHGEHWSDCAIRETLEEGGIQTHSPELFAITNDVFDGKHYVTLHVALKADTEAFTNAEPEKHQHLGWYEWDAIPVPRFPCIQSVYDQHLKPPYVNTPQPERLAS